MLKAKEDWPEEIIQNTNLGDVRRSKRLALILNTLLFLHQGFVNHTFKKWSEAKATYRWLNNQNITNEHLLEASSACCLQHPSNLLIVPLDASSLNIKDTHGVKNLGHLGSSRSAQRGYQVISALAYSPQGEALGLMSQLYWKRKKNTKSKSHYDLQKKRQRSYEEKETKYISQIALHCQSFQEKYAPHKKLWFQHDRGGDGHDLLKLISKSQHYWTLRASQDRNLKENHLLKLFSSLKFLGNSFDCILKLPRCGSHSAMKLYVNVDYRKVDIKINAYKNKNHEFVSLFAIQVRCLQNPSIQWKLLTNYPVQSIQDVLEVIKNYKIRWKVEEFYRNWKTNCQVEKTQLHREKPIQLWCILNAMVAMRIEKLKELYRQEEEMLAEQEFSKEEIQAILLLRKPKYDSSKPITLRQAVYWVAELGGYRGPKSSGGPPGSVVIGRGLEYITPAAQLLEHFTLVPKTSG